MFLHNIDVQDSGDDIFSVVGAEFIAMKASSVAEKKKWVALLQEYITLNKRLSNKITGIKS